MAEHSKFFDSLNPLEPDKEYTAEEFVGYFGKLITDGVMKGEANMLKVETSGSNMNTIVDTGTAFLKAREYENDSKLPLTHEVEALGKSRIDRVVIRLMLNVDYREAKAFVKKGVAGVAPVVPQLERTAEVHEISLAQVKVIGGQTYINVVDVVDERGKDDICPWAGSKILPNFNDESLQSLVESQLVDGQYALGSDATDFNDIKKPGFYSVKMSVANAPLVIAVDSRWLLEVMAVGPYGVDAGTQGMVTQKATSMLDFLSYSRFWYKNGWSPWIVLADKLNNTLTSSSTTQAATANAVKMVNDAKADKFQPSYITLNTANGWSGKAMAHRDTVGTVHVTLEVYNGEGSAGSVICFFPSDINSAHQFVVPALTGVIGATNKPISLQCANNSIVVAPNYSATGAIHASFSFSSRY